jgi:hypothetical protein
MSRFTGVESHFNCVKSRFAGAERRFTGAESQLTCVERHFTGVKRHLTGVERHVTCVNFSRRAFVLETRRARRPGSIAGPVILAPAWACAVAMDALIFPDVLGANRTGRSC